MKARMVIATALVLVALVALPMAANAQDPDPVQMMKDLFAMLEAGDIDGAVDTLSEDIGQTLIPPPQGSTGIYTGKEERRARWEEVLALNPTHEIWDCETSGTTTTCMASYDGDDTMPLGIGPLEFVLEFGVEDGLFTFFTWTLTDESMAAIVAATSALPETGGGTFPIQEVMLGLGGLTVAGGLGLERLRRRRR